MYVLLIIILSSKGHSSMQEVYPFDTQKACKTAANSITLPEPHNQKRIVADAHYKISKTCIKVDKL